MMLRRVFLSSSIAGGFAAWFFSDASAAPEKLDQGLYDIIEAVQLQMFPAGNLIPSAEKFHAAKFLEETILHPTYDKDLRQLVLSGAKQLQTQEDNFLNYSQNKKEEVLRAFEKTPLGRKWLDQIMILSLEGLLSDPIYGGNVDQSGWNALQTKGGEPRPKTRYINS